MGKHFGRGIKLRLVVRSFVGGGGDVVTPALHGENIWYNPDTDPGGRRWCRYSVDISGVLPVGTEVGGVPGSWVSGEGKQSREA